jgi:hypothetical protein
LEAVNGKKKKNNLLEKLINITEIGIMIWIRWYKVHRLFEDQWTVVLEVMMC